MRKYSRVASFGFLTWLIPFTVSVLIFPIHSSEHPIFESIMAAVVTASAVLFYILILDKIEHDFLKRRHSARAAWFMLSIALDLHLFTEEPMKMSFEEYMKDIGLTYLIMPTVTLGFGYLLEVVLSKRRG